MAFRAFPKRWPKADAKWREPKSWLEPGSRARVDLMDPGPLKPGDLIEFSDGRVMRVVAAKRRDWRVSLTLIDA